MANQAPTAAELAEQVAQLTAIVTNLTNAVANIVPAAPAGGGGGAPAPAPAATFAKSPGLADVDQLIDYKSKLGQNLFEQGSKALATPFDLKQDQIVIFEKELEDRASVMGWNEGTQNITQFNNAGGKTIDIIREYGQIDEATLKNECMVFISGAKADQRAAQNNELMWRCIYETLTEEAKATLLTYSDSYTVEHNNKKHTVAALMYKTIMRLATLDNNATVETLRENLRGLTQYAVTVNGDIDLVHKYFNQNFTQLKAKGESVDGVMSLLFNAYKNAVPDNQFKQYILRLYDDWLDQTGDMAGASQEKLMKKAKAKYDLLKSQGDWGKEYKSQEYIALEARLKLSDKLINKLNQENKAYEKQTQLLRGDSSSNNNSNSNKKSKNKKDRSNKRAQKADEEWKKTPPKDGEPKTKHVGNKDWHWCIHHMRWTVHKPNDCEKGKRLADKDKSSSTSAYASTLAQIALMAADE